MVIQISLAIIALVLLIQMIVLIKLSLQAERSVRLLQNDVQNVSKELITLLKGVNSFVQSDLHETSQSITSLIDNLDKLASYASRKPNFLDLVFKSAQLLMFKLNPKTQSTASSNKCEMIHPIINWITSGIFLLKTLKGVYKK